jgi:phage protein D
MTVRGLNLLHRFRLKQVTKPFFNKKDTEVAKELVKMIDEDMRKQFPGLRLRIAQEDLDRNLEEGVEEKHEFLVVNNQYPIVFLLERARRIGYELTIKKMPPGGARTGDVEFGWGPTSAVTRATYKLEWGKSLLSAQPTLRVAGQVSKVTVRGWSPGSKQPISEFATRDDLKKDKAGVVDPRELDLGEPALAQEISVDRPVGSKTEAKKMATEILKQRASELVIVKAKTIGLPDLRAGSKVRLLGLGDRFSGKKATPFMFLVTDTTHSFGDGGYTTEFTARMESGV